MKYSESKDVYLHCKLIEDNIYFLIQDHGKGFDPTLAENNKGLGLKNIESRIYLAGGKFKLDTAPGKGTKYVIKVPL